MDKKAKNNEDTNNKKTEKDENNDMSSEQEKINDLTLTLQRLQAEFENYKRRTENERKKLIENASKEMIQKILPVIDNFELALKNTNNHEEFVKGVEMIYAQLLGSLQDEGLSIIKTEKGFDPYLHEALLTEESKEKPGTILEVLQKGYMLNDVILRHSKVKVAKKA